MALPERESEFVKFVEGKNYFLQTIIGEFNWQVVYLV